MKKFLLLICLAACAPTQTEVKAVAYAAAIDTTCFMYAVEAGDNQAARKAIHKRCIEVLTEAHQGSSK